MGDTRSRYEGRYLGILERDDWEYTTRVNARAVVVIVPVTPEGELILVEQFRIPVEGTVIELPAGLVGDQDDPDEALLDAARRELEEETGFAAGDWRLLLHCPSSAGLTDEMLHVFLARDLRRVGPGGGDASEDIRVHRVPIDEATTWLDAKMDEGLMVDPKVYAGLFWLGVAMPAVRRDTRS